MGSGAAQGADSLAVEEKVNGMSVSLVLEGREGLDGRRRDVGCGFPGLEVEVVVVVGPG
jgi:hypothetical protein